jgi:hypothetical protein
VEFKRIRFAVSPERLQAAKERWLLGDYSQSGLWDYDAMILADAYCDLDAGSGEETSDK